MVSCVLVFYWLCAIGLVVAIFFKIYNLLTVGWCKSYTCLVGKTALITGGASGIGLKVALNLASRGCRIIIGDVADATEARDKIIAETKNENVVTKHLDLASLQSVRDFANDVIKTEKRLDILLNNAGIGDTNLVPSKDGLPRTMQVNFFGHFLLTHLLIDLLKKSHPSRIIFTSSFMAFFHNMSLESLTYCKENQTNNFNYSNSKFCMGVTSRILAVKLKEFGVTSNCVHPGVVKTPIWATLRNDCITLYTKIVSAAMSLLLLWGKNVEEGVQTHIHLACSKEVENITGDFFADCKPIKNEFFQKLLHHMLENVDKKFAQDIWDESVKLVKLKPNEML